MEVSEYLSQQPSLFDKGADSFVYHLGDTGEALKVYKGHVTKDQLQQYQEAMNAASTVLDTQERSVEIAGFKAAISVNPINETGVTQDGRVYAKSPWVEGDSLDDLRRSKYIPTTELGRRIRDIFVGKISDPPTFHLYGKLTATLNAVANKHGFDGFRVDALNVRATPDGRLVVTDSLRINDLKRTH